VKLKCLNKSYIITIASVFYGRTLPGSSICRSPAYSYLSDESSCSSDKNDVTAEVKEICEHKTSCNFTLKKETFGKDGCPNIYKYMDVEYSCGTFLFLLLESGLYGWVLLMHYHAVDDGN
jgi:hypothetical protein